MAVNAANSREHPECPPVGGRLNILEFSTAEGYGTHVRNEADGDMCGPASDTRICFSCNSSVHTQTTGAGDGEWGGGLGAKVLLRPCFTDTSFDTYVSLSPLLSYGQSILHNSPS